MAPAYAHDSELRCTGNGCLVGDFLLSRVGLSTHDVMVAIDTGVMNSVRSSFDTSNILKNSVKLSQPAPINSFTLTLDIFGYYTENIGTSFLNGKSLSYRYWFGSITPRIIIGYPILENTEIWASINYFSGPSDLWLNIDKGTTHAEIASAALELKRYIIASDVLMLSMSTGVVVSNEESNTTTQQDSIRLLGISWIGNELISYSSRTLLFPTFVSLGARIMSFSASLDAGGVFGELDKSDSFTRAGTIGPVFGGSDFYMLNVTSLSKYRIGFLEPIIGVQASYDIINGLRLTASYLPSLNFDINVGSVRITWTF